MLPSGRRNGVQGTITYAAMVVVRVQDRIFLSGRAKVREGKERGRERELSETTKGNTKGDRDSCKENLYNQSR